MLGLGRSFGVLALCVLALCSAACGEDLRIDLYVTADGIAYMALEAPDQPCRGGFLEVGQCEAVSDVPTDPMCARSDCIDAVYADGDTIMIAGCGERVRVPRPTSFPVPPIVMTDPSGLATWQLAAPAMSIMLSDGCGLGSQTCHLDGPSGQFQFCVPAAQPRSATARQMFAFGDTSLGLVRVWAVSDDAAP